MSQKYFKIIFTIILVVAATSIFAWQRPNLNNNDPKLEVDFLDVGQGDSILLRAPGGQNVLIDGGPLAGQVTKRLSENLPLGDKTIDLMILTHPHDDHVAGLINVLKNYQVKKILYTGALHTSPNYLAWLNLIKSKKIPLTIIDHPQLIDLGLGCKINILYPMESFLNKEFEDLNASSIVLKVEYQGKKILLAGDATTKEVETTLLQKHIDVSADVFKASHHGSDTSNSKEFLAAVKPQEIVISVGKDNQFGHPHPRALKRMERTGARIWRTDQRGTVKLIINNEQLSITN